MTEEVEEVVVGELDVPDDPIPPVEPVDGQVYFKKLCSDFIVVERWGDQMCGRWDPARLTAYVPPPLTEKPDFVTQEIVDQLTALATEQQGSLVINIPENLNSKEIRKQVHQFIKCQFKEAFNSSTKENGVLVERLTRKNRKEAFRSWPAGLPPILHFTLQKEGHEVSYALDNIARAFVTKQSMFQYAGLKDRRAITYQRVSVYKRTPDDVAKAVKRLASDTIKLSEFSYESIKIGQGCHSANVFYIVLRNCDIDEPKFNQVRDHGCLNFFGAQRFGSISNNTADIGREILRGNFKAAVDMLTNPEATPSANVAKFLREYRDSGDASAIVPNIPRNMLQRIELAILVGLNKNKDVEDVNERCRRALLALPLHSRSIYLHAYQSKLFNAFLSEYAAKVPPEQWKERNIILANPHLKDVETGQDDVYAVYNEVLAKDKVTIEGFQDIASEYGLHKTFRSLLIKPKNVSYRRIEHEDLNAPIVAYPEPLPDDLSHLGKGYTSLLVQFELQPGAYATTILKALFDREF